MTTTRTCRTGTRILYAALLGTTALAATPAAAQTWKGTTSTDWNDPTNWSTGQLPGSNDTATVDTSTPHAATIDHVQDEVKDLIVGESGSGTMIVQNGGVIGTRDKTVLGDLAGSFGEFVVTGAGSTYTNLGDMANGAPETIVGNNGDGTLGIFSGATYTDNAMSVGDGIGSDATVIVNDTGSILALKGSLTVGGEGTGSLKVGNGAQVKDASGELFVGADDGGDGSVTISGTGSSLTGQYAIVANGGKGDVMVNSGGVLNLNDYLYLGQSAIKDGAHDGSITIDGVGSEVNAASLALGLGTDGKMMITNRGALNVIGNVDVGSHGASTGTLTVDGMGSSFFVGSLTVGNEIPGITDGGNTGFVNLQNGAGGLVTGQVDIGSVGNTGLIKVDGAGSVLLIDGPLSVGNGGMGGMAILAGGSVKAGGDSFIGNSSTGGGVINIDGGAFSGLGNMVVGNVGTGLLELDNAGTLQVAGMTLGLNKNASGVAIAANGANVDVTGDMTIGQRSAGQFTVMDSAILSVDGNQSSGNGTITLGNGAGANGDLIIGSLTGAPVDPGIVNAARIQFGDGSGGVMFNHTSQLYTFHATLTGGNATSAIHVFGGVTNLTADSSGFNGATLIQGTNADATLIVSGKLGGAVLVGNDTNPFKSILWGGGTLAGAVDVLDKGTIQGFQGETLTMGSLVLEPGSTVGVGLGDTTTPGLFKVNGDLTLDGSLDVYNTDPFGAGVYRLFDYGGTLTDNGLDIGTVANGTAASDLSVQTSVAGQVNLVYVPGSSPPPPPGAYMFWDGDAAGNPGNGKVDGGDGQWTATSLNFTDTNGTQVGTYDPNLIVFEGQPGVVSASNSAGDIKFDTLNFAVDGYVLSGDQLTLDKVVSINVGDGTAAGASYMATITNYLTGAGGLNKNGLGTLILYQDNNYTGGTTITYGTIQLGNGDGSGSVLGDVVDNGTLAFDRTDIADPMYAYSFDGQISGTGNVHKMAADTLTLAAAETYAGGTYVEKGTLALGGNGDLSKSSGVDVSAGATFDISPLGQGTSIKNLTGAGIVELGGNTLTLSDADALFSGVIQGSGGLHLAGSSIFDLTGTNTYTGGTTIDSGALLYVGNSGTTGSIAGSVTDNGQLAFLRSDDVTFNGVISGTGNIQQYGPGALTLTAVNTYSGGTLIDTGTLSGSATSFGSGMIEDDSALVLNQPTDAVFANKLEGNGTLTKTGTGAINYTGTGGYNGVATIQSGLFAVNGALPNASFQVAAGATLGGNGVIGNATIASQGTIAPGNSIGLLTLNGNLSQAAGSTYAVELTSTGMNDRIVATGTATIAAGAVLKVIKLDAAPYVVGTDYTVLTAAGGVTGAYDLTGTLKVSNFLALEEVVAPTAIDLKVVKTKSFGGVGKTPNENNTGGGLDSLPDTDPVVGPILMLPDDPSADNAFDQLDGEIHASVKTAMIEHERFYRDAALGHLLDLPQNKTRLWGDYSRSWATNGGNGNAAAMTRNASNYLLGFDLSPVEGLRFGVLGGYGRTDVVVGARASKARIDSYAAGFYAGARVGALGVRFGADYGWQWLDTQRGVAFPGFANTLNARYSASTAQGFADIGYRIGGAQTNIEPFAQISWIDVATAGVEESGGAAALEATKQSRAVAIGSLGARGSAGFSIGGAKARFHASAGWRHTTGATDPDAMLAFVSGGATFDIFGAPLARSSAVADAGIEVDMTSRLRLTVGYTGQFAGSTRDNGVRAGLSLAF
jgi:outer membrane autotransporter protein